MAARHRRHRAGAPKPSWLVTIKTTPPAPARGDAAKKLAAPARSPILPSPSVWQKGMSVGDRGDTGVAPASPRIGRMGQVKGARRCSRARGPISSRGPAASGLPCGSLAGLLMGLFRRRSTGRKSRAYSKVRDVASDSSSSGSARASSSSGSAPGARAPRPLELAPPLPVPAPVVRRPAMSENAPSLWERRRGGAKVLEGLQLT